MGYSEISLIILKEFISLKGILIYTKTPCILNLIKLSYLCRGNTQHTKLVVKHYALQERGETS